MYVCNCHGVTEQDVIDLVDNSEAVFHYAGIAKQLKDNNSCCKCLPRTREVIDEAIKAKACRKQAEFTVEAYPDDYYGGGTS